MHEPPPVTTFLFTDLEGSTRLWELDPERMRPALAHHDGVARSAVEDNRGTVVKMIGDGMHAAFDDPLDAVCAALQLQQALANLEATEGIPLRARCGLHAGVYERRANDFFGTAVNRAARIMSAAHGGQVLLSQAVADLVTERLPAGITLRDLGTVRLRDLAKPEHVYQVTHPTLRQDFPPLRSLEAIPNNLPHQTTSFVGREHELVEIRQLLGTTRLLTLVGVGGLGKTRLSLQLAADVLDDYADGVWFVELAPLADPQRVAQAVASVVGVREDAGRPVIEALARFVKDRRLLLILDNCEHLVQACAELAIRLLQSGPNLKILASSRELLRVAGEITYPVPALATPDPQQAIPLESLTQYAAVHLFIDRATAAQPAFRVTEKNAAAVADICHRLDGIPLALELAAACVRTLSVERIAQRLSDRFHLLTGGDRTALPRQQTLRALIDWSYDLLSEPERALLRRLAVFAGGFTLEAAETVGAAGEITQTDVLTLLASLVDKSLVAPEAGGERYRLLDTVQEYARQRLDHSGEEEDARTRHLAFYLRFAEKARPELAGPEQGAWLARLDLEHENLLAAHAWCDRANTGAETGVRLVHAVKPYWFNRGLLGLGHRTTVGALARAGAQARGLARCVVLADAGQFCMFMGSYREAVGHLVESLAIARELGNTAMVARVLQPLGMAALGQGDVTAANGYLEEALALAREQGDKRELAAALNALAQLHRALGRLQTAEPLYEDGLALARELGDRESIAIGLLNLAMVAIGRSSQDRPRTMLLDALVVAEEIGSKRMGQSVLEVCAGLASLREEWERAAVLYGVAEAQTEQTGLRRDPSDEAFLAPLIAGARQRLGESAFAAAEKTGRTLTYENAISMARTWLERNQ